MLGNLTALTVEFIATGGLGALKRTLQGALVFAIKQHGGDGSDLDLPGLSGGSHLNGVDDGPGSSMDPGMDQNTPGGPTKGDNESDGGSPEPDGGTEGGDDPPGDADSEVSFTVTPEHPFWQADTETWTLVGDLAIGDRLLQRDGDQITITAIATLTRDEPFTVYNFTVDGNHNYYATTVDTLVHNSRTGSQG